MRTRRQFTVTNRGASAVWLVFCLALLTGSQPPVATQSAANEGLESGVVVETVAPGSALAAGMKPADVIVAWSVVPAAGTAADTASGRISTPYELADVQVEHLPRATIVFSGSRGADAMTWKVASGAMGVGFRPTLPPRMLSIYQTARDLERARNIPEAAARLREVARAAADAGSPLTAVWLLALGGTIHADRQQWEGADEFYRASRQAAASVNRPAVLAMLHRQAVRAYRQRADWPRATEHAEEALSFDRQADGTENLACALNYLHLAELAALQGDLNHAERHYLRSLDLRQRLAPDSVEVADVLNGGLANIQVQRGDYPGAAARMKQALAILERVAPDTLYMAAVVHNLGVMARNLGDLEGAETSYRRALAIREKVAPDSPHVAHSFHNLAVTAMFRGELEEAENLYRRALRIRERDVPNTGPVADTLVNLGDLLRQRGDFHGAESTLRRGLELMERLAPGSLDLATTLNNLGTVLQERGDLDAADAFHRRALAIQEQQASPPRIAESLNHLGSVAVERRDFDVAEALLARALKINESLAPNASSTAAVLTNLGNNAQFRGHTKAADRYFRRALAILDRSTDGLRRVATLNFIAGAAMQRGDLATARAVGRQAVELGLRVSPAGRETALALRQLAATMLRQNDMSGAEEYARQSLRIFEDIAPGSGAEAATLHLLGRMHERLGRPAAAFDNYTRAIAAFERQTTRVGGAHDVRSSYSASGEDYYASAVALALKLGRPEEAFNLQERARGRSFLATLAERDLLFEADVPADVAREQRLTDAEYDRTVDAMSALGPDRRAEINRHVQRLRALRDRREQLIQRVRQLSPRLAALKYPEPLGLHRVRASLDPDTVLLAYWVGPRETRLFIVHPTGAGPASGLTVFTLAANEKRLRTLVTGLLSQIRSVMTPAADPRAVGGLKSPSPIADDSRHKIATELYDLLLKPAAKVTAPGTRLLIVPDGPLHILPFGVLRVRGAGEMSARYLIESNPITTVVSATVYEQSRRTRRTDESAAPTRRLVAFGDPLYQSSTLKPEIRVTPQANAKRGFVLSPLPATRKEVQGIAKLFPAAADVFLGAEATEDRAKSIGRDASYVHIASHALLDEYLPLNSALAFTMPSEPTPGRANGLLQVWEVFEHVQLDADLVTLSACETGLGMEVSGEGLIGLTRAFQFAGARSVVASLWGVADDSTAQLMTRFYSYLRAGKSKDEALRSAQVDAIRAKTTYSHPFHWAAFQLFGDWK